MVSWEWEKINIGSGVSIKSMLLPIPYPGEKTFTADPKVFAQKHQGQWVCCQCHPVDLYKLKLYICSIISIIFKININIHRYFLGYVKLV